MSNLEGILGSAARLIFQLSKNSLQRTQKSIEKSFLKKFWFKSQIWLTQSR